MADGHNRAMSTLSPNQIIVLVSPVFFLLIAVEFAVGLARKRNTYRLDDAITSIGLGMLSQVTGVFSQLLRLGIYTVVYQLAALGSDTSFWTSPVGWVLALLLYDFFYYWNHRFGHEVAVFWAAHVVHHQSQDYNLSTALRQPSTYALLGWVFYLPMALLGVPPLVFVVVGLIDLLYQYWIHTEQIGRLGWFDRVFASPSNHRVHHAVNDRYLDKNYGGILILWDRLFGTFTEEDPAEPCVYGTRSPLNSWDPLWANAEVYTALMRESWHTRRWPDKLRVWFKPPGWRPADMQQRFPKPAFSIDRVKTYAPPMSRGVMGFAAVQFSILLGGVSAFLWFTDSWPLAHSLVWLVVLTVNLWAVGAVMQGRIGIGESLLIECASLAMATAAVGATGLHWFFKPLTMVLALVVVVLHWRQSLAALGTHVPEGLPRALPWLLAALAASLAGDALLMVEGFFLPGLVAFLLAHLAYIVLFRQSVPWGANRWAWPLLGTFALAAYAMLWNGGLPEAMRLPVAVYVLAITTMAGSALDRSASLGTTSSHLVAVGALCFMVSDLTLAINRFITPLPHASAWVLSSYYLAQCLIVMGMLRQQASDPSSDMELAPAR
jgi:alkylglycerol monooxygenase